MSGALAPAKVNLVLRVGPRRPDGFHELASLVVALDVGDVLEIERAPETRVEAPRLRGGDTLVTRALALLGERAGAGHGFAVSLEKRLPVGAGLGGGSSDAGVALRTANALLDRPLPLSDLLEIASAVGSDVAFFTAGAGAAELRGRGEQVRPLALASAPVLVLAWPGLHVATADVYRSYTSPWDRAGFARAAAGVALAARADTETLAGLIANDLGPVAELFCPPSAVLLRELRTRGALAVAVSGSGSAVFGLFAQHEDAERAAAGLPGAVWSAVAHVLGPGTISAV